MEVLDRVYVHCTVRESTEPRLPMNLRYMDNEWGERRMRRAGEGIKGKSYLGPIFLGKEG